VAAIQPVQNRPPVDLAAAAPAPKPAPETKPPAPAADTVQISSAGQAALHQSLSTPAHEAAETLAQTTKEAAGGDSQARAKLAREEAASKA